MKVIVYKCNLCEQNWNVDNVFGIMRDDEAQENKNKIFLIDPKDSERHICRSCIMESIKTIDWSRFGK